MKGVSERFVDLASQIGGFAQDNLDSWIYLKSPLTLFHWTMNVIEVLLILGAVVGLRWAWTRWKAGQATFLCFWLASVVFMLAMEVPVYFPEKIGGDANDILFLHNEFTINFFFGRAPLYIMALYPALMFSSFVLMTELKVVRPGSKILLAGVVVGFAHHIFYEIFDHFGPQYGWWIWNHPQFLSHLGAVPVSSMLNFAFLGPVLLTWGVLRLLPLVEPKGGAVMPLPQVLIRSVFAGLWVPVATVLVSPATWFAVLGVSMTAMSEVIVASSILIGAALLTWLSLRAESRFVATQSKSAPVRYLWLFVLVFALLWGVAVPDYLAAEDGVTALGTATGSLSYAMACLCVAIGLLLRGPARREE